MYVYCIDTHLIHLHMKYLGGWVSEWMGKLSRHDGNVAVQSVPPSSQSLCYAHVSTNMGVFTLSQLSRGEHLRSRPPHLLAHGGLCGAPWAAEAPVYWAGLEPAGETQLTWLLGGPCLWEGPQAQL